MHIDNKEPNVNATDLPLFSLVMCHLEPLMGQKELQYYHEVDMYLFLGESIFVIASS